MKKIGFFILCCLGTYTATFAQELLWKAGVHSFFDNAEFGHSRLQIPQTMAGVHIAPQIGVGWKSVHRIFVGADLMHEYGSNKIIDYTSPTAYYEFDSSPFRFIMGAFPRKMALENYPRMFFRDSINNYRPNINGLFWEFRPGSNNNHINVWLDWTSRQTHTRHEAFFMGWSGRYNKGIFYGQHFGYMFHFAGVMDPEVPEGLHDNGLVLTSLGVDLASKTGFDKLEANIGWAVGLERDRDLNIDKWITPQGILSEIKVEYKGLGVFNTFYGGGKQQVYYSDHRGELYWGDPIYRAGEYDRADFYINFFKTDVVNVKFVYSMHFAEGTSYNEQMLYATFYLDNLEKKTAKPYQYIWSNWFK